MRNLLSMLVFASVAGVAAPASSQAWPSLEAAPAVVETGTDDVALLIGVEDYLLLPDVPGATQNVRDWETFLRDGLGVSTIVTLRDTEAVREEILSAAERVRDRAKPGANVWFVFVGHGAPSPAGDDGMLVGADGQQTVNSLGSRSVAQSELARLLSAGEQERTLMIIDACFSGRDGAGEALAKGAQPVVPVEISAVPKGVTLMTAARSSEFAGALPETERPAFSYLMLGAARGWADDGDGRVTADEAVRFARNELEYVVGRQQTPQLIGPGDALLSTGGRETPPERKSLQDEEPKSQPVAMTKPAGGGHPVLTGLGSAPTTRSSYGTEPVTDDLMYAKGHLALSSVDGLVRFGPMLTFTPGIKLLQGKRLDVRIGALTGLRWERNTRAPSEGDTYDDPAFGTSKISSVSGAWTTWAELGVGPGLAYRLRTVGAGVDQTLYLDSAIGFEAALGGECVSYEREFITDCTSREAQTDMLMTVRFGGEFPVFDLATFFTFKPSAGETIVGLALGLSIDR